MESDLRKYLQAEFERRKRKNSRYSIRGFARDLQIDATALSRILHGSRPIGPKVAKQILSRIELDPTAREVLLRSLIGSSEHGIPSDSDYVSITAEQLEQMDEWIYSAVLGLARSKNLRLDSRKFASFFGIKISEVEPRIKRLLELGMLKQTERGFRTVNLRATALFSKNSAAVKKIHAGYISKALEGLSEVAEAERDISGITVLISRAKLPEAVRRIKEFRRSLATFLESDEGEDLYRINVQLFPLKKS